MKRRVSFADSRPVWLAGIACTTPLTRFCSHKRLPRTALRRKIQRARDTDDHPTRTRSAITIYFDMTQAFIARDPFAHRRPPATIQTAFARTCTGVG